MLLAREGRSRIHMVMGRRNPQDAAVSEVVALIAKEEDGQLLGYRTAYSR
jgi:hypothetical protein